MTVLDLNRDQLIELKNSYMVQLADEGVFAEVMGVDYDEPSCEDVSCADERIPDEVIFEHYDGIDFTPDDFFCSAGEEESV